MEDDDYSFSSSSNDEDSGSDNDNKEKSKTDDIKTTYMSELTKSKSLLVLYHINRYKLYKARALYGILFVLNRVAIFPILYMFTIDSNYTTVIAVLISMLLSLKAS
jgi:hypothetical protein